MAAPVSYGTPTLESGDRLSPEEFDRIYALCSDIRKAELIDGVVYVASPVRINAHSRPYGRLGAVLHYYADSRPGVLASSDGTVLLADGTRVQPDIAVYWNADRPGTARENEDDYLEGPPELVAEIAGSSVSIDLHAKFRVYERNGVKEYIVWRTRDRAIDFFRLHDGRFVRVEPDNDGVFESAVFPGLRISTQHLLKGDTPGAIAVLKL